MANAQKELKEMYRYILERDCWKDKSMIEYLLKECSQVVVFPGGKFIVMTKPDIEKRFCFGYGYEADDYEEAANMARHARTNEEYFINENMKQITEKIEALDRYDVYFTKHYYNQPDYSPYKAVRFIYSSGEDVTDEMEKATPEEIEILRSAYQEELKKFEKRLNTYLKRYGLTNISTWTYNSWD